MSKDVKDMLVNQYKDLLGDYEDAAVISLRGINANDNNSIRSGLAKKNIRITVIRNKLFGRAFEGTGLAGLEPVLTGSNALAYGGESAVLVAREIVALLKDFPGIELKGAILDGELFEGDAGVKALSKMPTRDEAIAQDVALILGPGQKLAGAITGPGAQIAGVLKAIADKLEAGETISAN